MTTNQIIPRIALLSLMAIVLTFFSCSRHLTEQTLTNPDANLNVLIAGDASEYKDGLRNAIIENFRRKANIRVVNINTLSSIKPEDYHAILIMDTCLAWTHFNPTVLAFLDLPTAQDRVVWFMTVDDIEERYQHQGVDAITAASVTTNQAEVSQRLSRQINTLLTGQP